MQGLSDVSPRVSVIIPVYNCEDYLHRCLDSVFGQTMQSFEVIAVNDGSTDSSLQILREYETKHPNLRVIDQKNAGQGAARNHALELAQGEYVLFVDSDDFIESVTLQVTTERADRDQSDLVHFDWKLYVSNPERSVDYHYYNADPFWHKWILEGAECDELLRVESFFSVSNLYRRSFLRYHGIRFEEGRIYEDNPFVVQAVNRAERVSMVHSPLYIVNPHPASTTRSHAKTDKHYRDHIYAMRKSFELLDRRNPRAATYLAAYHIKKIGPYYERRIPRKFRRAYIRDFVDVLHAANVTVPPNTSANRPTRLSVALGIFEHCRYALFQSIVVAKNHLMPRFKRVRNRLRKMKHRKDQHGAWSAELEAALEQPIMPKTISFLGLDFKYAGNSKYLFEEMIADPRFSDCTIRFVTKDDRVDERLRLVPGQVETNVWLARSELVIAESWIPPKVRKHRDSTWVQLWHGTPLKRMLFDSHEPRIIWNRRKHKINKYRDIQNWDYLVVDCEAAIDKFATSFLFDPEKMIRSGYPRVKYLIDNDGDQAKKHDIMGQLGLRDASEKRVVLYAPTWRDYNYGRKPEDCNYDYVLDVEALASELDEDTVVIFHDHGYLSSKVSTRGSRCIDASSVDIQDLLLVSDVVISDYSSVIFDAFAINRQVILYVPDEEQFVEYRGLYEDMWGSLRCLTTTTVKEICWKVQDQGSGGVSTHVVKQFTYGGGAVDEELSRFILGQSSRSVAGELVTTGEKLARSVEKPPRSRLQEVLGRFRVKWQLRH